MSVRLQRETWLDADGRAVAGDDPAAVRRIGGPGARVSDAQARAYGLVNGDVPVKAAQKPRGGRSRYGGYGEGEPENGETGAQDASEAPNTDE